MSLLFDRFFCGVGAVVLFTSLACAQMGPAGHWEGSLAAGDQPIGLSLDVAKDAKGEWIASMGVPSEHATGLVVMNLAVNGSSVKFVALELMMAKVELTVGPDGVMKGTFTGPQGSQPIEFKRTGEGKPERIPASPAVSKELEGDWEGALAMGNRTFRIIFHFRNQPDKTVAATIDTPDTGGMGMPLNGVKQTRQELEVGIRIAHASFKGTLNKEGTEIVGQFQHDEAGVPLTMRKK